ncbi:MAG TPA: class I SAM-dependent RNA methyltransferase [Bryobacteraceae bacterium]|nr:class I SAM-dependent RNA methyltransferase [Bryobacteraceae bacterium]
MPTEETLTIEKLVYGGEGLARVEGKVVFIPYVLPGEVVRAEVSRIKNDLWRGRLVEAIQPSPARVAAPCPYFQRCGGCHYQHAGYEQQLEQKRLILREVLRRVGKIEFSGDIGTIAGEPWQYRNRMQLHIANGAAGYFEHGSHKLCAIDHCPIVSPALNDAIAKLSRGLPPATATVELFTNESQVQVNILDRVPKAALAIFESLGSNAPLEYNGFRVSRNSFFQVNRFLIEQLVECAIGDLAGESAVDLYAGVGLFAVRLAQRYKKVTAVESSQSAFRDLEHNTQQSVHAVIANSEDYLAGLGEIPDLVLADPPRAGLGKIVVRELARIRAPRVTIVSCDPATLARDLQGLLASGYRIERVTLVDLFPQTYHLETVASLVLSSST